MVGKVSLYYILNFEILRTKYWDQLRPIFINIFFNKQTLTTILYKFIKTISTVNLKFYEQLCISKMTKLSPLCPKNNRRFLMVINKVHI